MIYKIIVLVAVFLMANIKPLNAMEKSSPRMPSSQYTEIQKYPSEEEQQRLIRNRLFLEEAMKNDEIPKDVRNMIAQKEYDLVHKDIIYCPTVESVNKALKENVEFFPKEPWLLFDENFPLIIVEQGFHFSKNNDLSHNKIKILIRENKDYINMLVTVKMNNSDIVCTYAHGAKTKEGDISNFIEVSMPRLNDQYEIVSMEQSKDAKGYTLRSQNGQFYYNLAKPSEGINSQDILLRIIQKK